jgi:ribosomal protein S18 acetylase RimI-like enzyme
VTAVLDRGREAAGTAFAVERASDPNLLRDALTNRAYAAYALAQLEPRRLPQSDWFVATGPQGRRGLVVHSSSGLGRALFAEGDPVAVDAILSLHPGPRFTFGSVRPEHFRTLERYFVVLRRGMMTRMAISAETFSPVEGEAVRLRGPDIAAVNRLYSTEGGPTSYTTAHLEEGVYYGVRVDGRLVAVAGTHVVSEAEGVAVVGNVFTHPRYRGQGHSRIATSATTRELLQRCPLVVLTVETVNEPALRVYRRLGYESVCSLHESPLVRKEPLGVISLARRAMAGWRGRAEGKEVVIR